MTNLLILHLGLGPCVIETIRLYSLLQERGELNMRSLHAEHITREDVKWCDVAVFIRSTSTIELHLMELFQKCGKYVILVMDDDLLSLDASYGKDGEGFWEPRKRVLKNILYHVDCLIAVNENLKEKYTKLGNISKSVLTNTMVDDDEFFPDRQTGSNNEIIKLALYVNDGTTCMFDMIIRPVLPKLAEKYPHQIELLLMSLHPNLDEISDRIKVTYVAHMPYKEFKKYLGTETIDIGLAPLIDTGFSMYKYFNKFIEYTLAGIPSIYSDCALYRKVIQDGKNGLLCQNTIEGWYDAICFLIDNPVKRKEIVTNAQEYLKNNFSVSFNVAHLKSELPQITNHKAPSSIVKFLGLKIVYIKTYYMLFRMMGWLYMLKIYLKKRKFKALYRRFYTHFINRR